VKIAVLSDIHGNNAALQCVLREIEKHRVNKIFCLGDLLDFGPEPAEVVNIIQKERIATIKGNHDQCIVDYQLENFQFKSPVEREYLEKSITCTRKLLTDKHFDFLENLPLRMEIEIAGCPVLFIHSIPDMYNYPGEKEIRKFLQENKYRYVFYGHIHRPAVYCSDGKMAINPGSVGKPKHGNAMACFCLIQFGDRVIKELAFKFIPYPVEETCRKILQRGFPQKTIEVIRTGIYKP
jgi:putative phosphoesterase